MRFHFRSSQAPSLQFDLWVEGSEFRVGLLTEGGSEVEGFVGSGCGFKALEQTATASARLQCHGARLDGLELSLGVRMWGLRPRKVPHPKTQDLSPK